MRSLIMKQAERFLRERKNGRRWLAVFTCLAVMVALGTVTVLRYTGTAMTGDLRCGLEEHIHAEGCYQENLICGQEAAEGHEHTAECYEKQLTCNLKEHTHTDACYAQEEETAAAEADEVQAVTDVGEEYAAPEANETQAVVNGVEGFMAPEINETRAAADGGEEAVTAETQDQAQMPETGSGDGRRTLTMRGEDYAVTVSYGDEAGIPENAELSVKEILAGSAEYEAYYREMLAAVAGKTGEAKEAGEEAEVSFARFFDITFMADGVEVEPAAPVDIRISYLNDTGIREDEAASVVHFAEEGAELLDAEVVENEEGRGFAFTQEK